MNQQVYFVVAFPPERKRVILEVIIFQPMRFVNPTLTTQVKNKKNSLNLPV